MTRESTYTCDECGGEIEGMVATVNLSVGSVDSLTGVDATFLDGWPFDSQSEKRHYHLGECVEKAAEGLTD